MNHLVIHIATEVVVIAGVFIYFSKQNTSIRKQLEDANSQIKSLQESNEKLQKHIGNIYSIIETLQQEPNTTRRRTKDADQMFEPRPEPSIRKRYVKRQMPVEQNASTGFDNFVNDIDIEEHKQQDQQRNQEEQMHQNSNTNPISVMFSNLGPMMESMMGGMMGNFNQQETEPKVEIVDETDTDDLKEELASLKPPENESKIEIYDI